MTTKPEPYFKTSYPTTAFAGTTWDHFMKTFKATRLLTQMPFDYWSAIAQYQSDFLIPFSKAVRFFHEVEQKKILRTPPLNTFLDYLTLFKLNNKMAHEAIHSSVETMLDYHLPQINESFLALLAFLEGQNGDIFDYLKNRVETVKAVAHDFPKAIQEVEDEFGFHFERDGHIKIAETDRFILYQVLPNEEGVTVRKRGKPVLIVHPYVLGADILAFLPTEKKSYVHCFANQGIPTYIRILKDIRTNEPVQKITLEDDIRDTKRFCEILKSNHGRLVTLNGYCQGGLITLCALLSGEVDDLVDAHITCVAPIDGTRSERLGKFLKDLPERFNSLEYGAKRLPNGNLVADGDLMSWIYKLKSIEEEFPMVAFYRNMAMFDRLRKKDAILSKTILALNYWIYYQRHDLPMEITKLSFASYNTPVTGDGTLPFKAFDRPLNIKRIAEKEIDMLICYGESDALVEKPSALAPLDYIEAEVTPFPKGHVAIATSWSLPTSEYALHTRFGDQGKYRGPVRFQLDLE